MARLDECPLAVVGMGACFPGATTVAEFWTLLRAGRCAIAPLPPARLDRELYHDPRRGVPGKTYSDIGGVVPDELLDVAALGLEPGPAAQADVAHLWLLKVALDAVRDAGIAEGVLAGSRTGVYVGHARGSGVLSDLAWAAGIEALTARVGETPAARALPEAAREALLRRLVAGTRARYPGAEAAATPMMQANAAPRLIARRLRTAGPYLAVDAACASSIAALDVAARALAAGEVETAIVGGCSFSQWSSLVMFSQAHALSARGCFPFDARGDGFVSSDGYAAIVVTPLARARAAGLGVRAVIRGIGAACDGRGKALWAPQQRGQVAAMRRAYAGGLDAGTVQVVEAHATGTQVGDDTELRALAEVLGAGRGARNPLPVGSVKGNVGHTREAAGLASLVKMVLAMEHGEVPATAGFDPATPTRRVDWERLPLRVVAAREPWPDLPGRPRRCAVDCFGIGGIDYHVVLDAADTATGARRAGAPPPPARAGRAVVRERAAIAVVGAGVVLPGAPSLAALAATLDEAAPAAAPPPERWDAALFLDPAGGPYRLRSVTGAFLSGWSFDCQRHRVPPRQAERTDPLQLMLLDAAAQALAARSGGALAADERARTGVFVGSVFGSDHMADTNTALRVAELLRDLEAEAAALSLGGERARRLLADARAALSGRYPVHDEAGSFSSSTLASRIARHLDLNGPCLAIDAEEASGMAALAAALRALAAGECDLAFCCAGQRTMHFGRFMYYDRMGLLGGGPAAGVVPAEGAAALLLRRAADAEAAGERVLAVVEAVRGAAAPGAPWKALARAVREAGAALAGGARPALVECFAGPGGALAARERRALGARADGADLCSASARAGMTQGASAIVGLVHAALRAARRADAGPVPVAVDSVGLQGLGYHARLRVPAAAPAARALAAAPLAATPETGAGRRGERPRVAFVFPGQGSQYPGMVRDLLSRSPAARDAAAECDAALAAAGEPAVAELCWEGGAARRLGSDTRATQLAMLVADVVTYRALAALGCEADVVLGHSFGEYAALVAAGCWSIAEAVAAVRERSRVLESLGPAPGRLIATGATRERLATLLATLGDGVHVAAVNSPGQTVVAAATARVDEVVAALVAAGEKATPIPAPQPFHSPLLAPARPGLRRALAAARLSPPRTPFLAAAGARYAADPDDLRECLVRQLAEPLDFVALVRRAYADGVRVFVEVGPRDVATRLVRAILAGGEATALACDEGRGDGGERLPLLRDRLAALGGGTARPAAAADAAGALTPYAATRRPPAPAAPVLHVDATAARRAAAPGRAAALPAASAPPAGADERLVVAVVSEHTGCPPEALHLDLDLEADLGIDSIAKAQLLGELADRGALGLAGGARSAPDPGGVQTLRDVVRALAAARAAAPAPSRGAAPAPPAARANAESAPAAVRWVPRVEAIGRVRDGAPRALATAIVGPGELADALAAELRRTGSETAVVTARGGGAALSRARRLVLLGGSAAAARPGSRADAAADLVLAVRDWVRGLAARGRAAEAELVAVTALGGDLGFSPARPLEPAGGAAAGLVKAAARELSDLRCRVVDVEPGAPPAELARAVAREMAEPGPLEVGLVRGRRFAVALRERPLPIAPDGWHVLAPAAAWVVTGGATGITARCAVALGERHGVHLHLIGSAPLEPVPDGWLDLDAEGLAALRAEVVAGARARGEAPAEAWRSAARRIERQRTLAALARAGVRHSYHRADVTRRRSLAAALAAVRDAGAPIRGIVHGAGVESACALAAKRAAAVRATLRVKVTGLENLLALTAADPVGAVLAFGSVSGRWGGHGQADYAAANELLAKTLAAHRRRTGARCSTILWPPWDETGMAVRPETRLALERAGWRAMPVAEGVAHFLGELASGLPESEVLIADRRAVAVHQEACGGRLTELHGPSRARATGPFPLLDASFSCNGNGSRRAELVLDPVADPFLADHRLDGDPVLPAVISLEALAEASAGGRAGAAVCFRDASFHAAFRFRDGLPRRLEVRTETGESGVNAELRGERALGDGRIADPEQLVASAVVVAAGAAPATVHRPPPRAAAWREVAYGAAGERGGPRIAHGPALRALRRLCGDGDGDGDGGWGELVAPAAAALRRGRAGRRWLLPAALLDGCLVACGLYARERFGVVGVPAHLGELRVLAVPRAGTRCTVAFALRERDERSLRFDFTLADAGGRLVAVAADYRAAVLADLPEAS